MAQNATLEPFPILLPHQLVSQEDSSSLLSRRPRKSSGLPSDPRGDTGVGSFSAYLGQKFPDSPVQASSSSVNHSLTLSASGRSFPLQQRPEPVRGRKRRKAKSLLRRWKSISLRHTWINPLILVLVILGLYIRNPTPSNPVHGAIFLSYPVPPKPGDDPAAPLNYGKGGKDFVFVAFYTIVLTFTREFLMQRLIRPLGLYGGIRNRAKLSRFMEQLYTAIYFGIMGPFGVYVMSRSPAWYFDTKGMFEGFPHREHEGLFKAYYLIQAAYWVQQAIVLLLQLEKPRKDFKELVAHHIVTISLIWLSYRFHFAFMGIGVYITHDISDFFLATSKVLNYLDHWATIPYIVVFMCVWAYMRHYLNLKILYAVLTDFRTVGPFELNWETQQYKCWISQIITFSLLACLQAVNIFWFFLILRIAKRAVFNSVAKDDRSEDGEDEEPVEGSTQEKRERMAAAVAAAQEDVSAPQVATNGAPKEMQNGVTQRVTRSKAA